MKCHRDLDVWKYGMELAEEIYRLSKSFPRDEQYGLTNQLRRAAVSVASNISEGAARQTKKEFTQFLYTALGSVAEVETQLELAERFGYMSKDELLKVLELRERVAKMLFGLIRKLKD